ncbi:MAG TPA: DUF4215 domain-containing protein, partial [Nannocystaceae bacterium]|nr:DUF4215 domain-containing protein [Nannocystaceae bacterium]
ICGDSIVQAGVEECDDGNADDADACTNACMNAKCGDGIVGPGEMCDDGNDVDTDDCTNACAPASCGDGIVQDGVEECDDMNAVDTDACLSTCKAATCGDGQVQAGVEECDDMNAVDTDACLNTCKNAKCGDMVVQMGAEECDDGNAVQTDACLNTCKNAKCGDTFVQMGVEECDDGNAVQTDACINTCKNAKCGDTFAQTGVDQCDDGNQTNGDGCNKLCKTEAVYLTSSNGQQGFYGYNIATNMWSTLANPPNVTRSQITNDGSSVYLLGSNNVIYKYNPATNAWTTDPTPGPNANEAGNPLGYFKWTNQGFYYLKDGSVNLRHYKNNAWALITLAGNGSSAGSWDRANNELYIRTYAQLGFRVINTTNDTVARTITDATAVGENNRTGSLSGGFFYDRFSNSTIQKLDKTTGAKTNTGVTPVSDHCGTDTDLNTGLIYFSGYGGQSTSFQRFNPANNSIQTLANQPSVPDHSTITVLIPPP